MTSNYHILEEKLSKFRRKYLLYHLIKGVLLFLMVSGIHVLLVNVLEYFMYLSSDWRKLIFIGSVLFIGLVFIRFVMIPLLQWTGFYNRLSNRKTSVILNFLIPDIQDKLLNVIELQEENDHLSSDDIRIAAINQKIEALSFFDFNGSLSFRNLRTLMYYFAASFLIVGGIHLVDKSFFVTSSNRIIHYNQQFVKPAPYQFSWLNAIEGVEKGSNFTIEVKCTGSDLPSMVYINIGGHNLLMKSVDEHKFEYEMVSVINPVSFYFTDLKYTSENFFMDIIPVPLVNKFEVNVYPPAYTALGQKKTDNIGDLKIPKGSRVRWEFEVFDTDDMFLVFDKNDTVKATREGRIYWAEKWLLNNSYYEIWIKNRRTEAKGVMSFNVEIIEDFYPVIKVFQVHDSVNYTRKYFYGKIDDDYGFSGLNFGLTFDLKDSLFTIPFLGRVMPQDFYFAFDMNDFKGISKEINYYFTVTDNDQVNGPKTASSESFLFIFPDKEEMIIESNKAMDNVAELIMKSQELADQIRKDLKELQMKNLNRNMTEWERSGLLQNIAEKKENLEDILEKIERSFDEMKNYNQSFSEQSRDILQKQEEIQRLLDDVLTDELKKLLEEFNQLAKEFREQNFNRLSQNMDMGLEDLSKQLERNLQMLKKLKIEKNLHDIIEQVEELADKQENAAKNAEEGKEMDRLINEMIGDHQKTEDIQSKLQEILEENDLLDKPLIFDDFDLEFNEIKENMRQSMQELQKGEKRNSSRSMKKSAESLKNMAFSMKQMMNANTQKENMENIQNLKQILKNLLVLSFEQEDLHKTIRTVNPSDPVMQMVNRRQKELILQSDVVRDSLYALAVRAPQIGNVVNNELVALSLNMERASELLNEGIGNQAMVNQQLAITSANNLSLMLSDVLQQIEDMMNNAQEGEGEQGSGKAGKKMGMMKQQGENLKEQLERMIQQMRDGGQPMSREMSESLMMHEMMQQMLRELMNSGNIGEEARKQLMEMDRLLEQNRRDLVNRNIHPQMVNRQNQIMTRLLEAERAELERDQDNRRESNTADQNFYSNPAVFFNHENEQNITIEYLQKNSFKLNNFYQEKYKNYVERYNNENP